MRSRLPFSAVLLAVLAVMLAAAAAVASPVAQPAAITRTSITAASPINSAFLVTGQQVAIGPAGVAVRPGGPGSAGQLQELQLGRRTLVLPIRASAYVNRGLALDLFEPTALATAESAGRLPVRISYSAGLPALPGVTITSSGHGTAAGYLTAAGARAFGAALERQPARENAAGPDELLAGRVSVALAGTPTAPRQARNRPAAKLHTLTVRGFTLSGQPETGGLVTLIDADDASLTFRDAEPFRDGIATFSVPAGHFWVQADFPQRSGTQYLGSRLVVPPQITVDQNKTVRLSARAATSRVQFVTPRASVVYSSIVRLAYLTYHAPDGCCAQSDSYISQGLHGPAPFMYVSPMAVRPRVGTLTEVTSAQLDSPPRARGVPYQYYLVYQAKGRVPAQRFVVHAARLATERARFYAAKPSSGYLMNFEDFPAQDYLESAVLWSAHFPLRLTMYLSAGSGLSWTTSFIPWAKVLTFNGGQAAPPQVFRPGQQLTDDWGAYPLHPSAPARLNGPYGAPVMAAATRTGTVLDLAMTTFGDNTWGHTGQAIGSPFKPTGRYELDQNGALVARGTLPSFQGFIGGSVRLSPARARIRFALDVTQPTAFSPLSTAIQTAWTWWSAQAAAGAELPRGWLCADKFSRACAAQPLLTLRYGVAGEALDGAVRAGRQVITLAVGHLQPAAATRITRAAMSVSFDGGRTWHRAQVTGRDGRYTVAFTAPAGALVTLRTSAADTAGGTVTQTIAGAYRIAARQPAARRAARPQAPDGLSAGR
jgi:hypothetical protein